MTLTRKSAVAFGALVTVVSFGGLTLSAQSSFSQTQTRTRRRAPQQYGAMLGTYELDLTRGDNPENVAQLATRNMPAAQRDEAYNSLLDRLLPPEALAIQRRGNSVTMSSTAGELTTFVADGATHREPVASSDGRTASTRAVFTGDRLSITSQGNRSTDFAVTFEPLQAGNELLVTRQIYNAEYPQALITKAYYTRLSTVPRWDLYEGDNEALLGGTYDPQYPRRNDPNANAIAYPRNRTIVPEGRHLSAVLDTPIDTRIARAGDPFTMTVQGPNEYRDAKIEGVIRSATVSSTDKSADLMIDFNTIRMPNGQTGSFEAILETVRKPGGEVLSIASEQTDKNNTKATVETSAIGAAIGSVIGVLTGGKKGAVIGAVIGGAAGAGGAILANSRDRYLDLPIGTEVTIVTTAQRGGTRPLF